LQRSSMNRFAMTVSLAAAAAFAQPSGKGLMTKSPYEGMDAYMLSNDRLELTVVANGGAFANLVMKNDPRQLSPLWSPARMARAAGEQPRRVGSSLGHFVCVDGFGSSSPEEQKAGLPAHGEARNLPWEVRSSSRNSGTSTAVFSVTLPLVQEVFTRTVQMVDGENVIYVKSELENLMAFDRPVNWGEHATVSAPFLEPEVTVVDWPAVRSMTRPDPWIYPEKFRFPPGKEFTWPIVTLRDGSIENIRTVPATLGVSDHTTNLMDPSRKHAYATVLNPKLRMIIGWVFKPDEYPWVQDWENYPENGRVVRGLEFATQPFDVPRHDAIQRNSLFGVPTYRWLPAKSKISSRFLIFFTQAPEGMQQVDEVRLEGGQLIIEDRKTGKQLVLAASLPLSP
jgi:hypothetical protein